MNPKETLSQFLHQHKGASHPNGEYHLTYNEVLCSAYIIHHLTHDELTIKPLYSNQDIGEGAGNPITKTFPLPPPKEDYGEIEKERI